MNDQKKETPKTPAPPAKPTAREVIIDALKAAGFTACVISLTPGVRDDVLTIAISKQG